MDSGLREGRECGEDRHAGQLGRREVSSGEEREGMRETRISGGEERGYLERRERGLDRHERQLGKREGTSGGESEIGLDRDETQLGRR